MLRRPSLLPCRTYTTQPPKVPIALIAALRKQTHVSVSKARDALAHSSGSIPDALAWLQKDLVTTGLAKAAKVSGRATTQGLIAHSVLSHGAGLRAAGGVRAAVVELNCETDFVGQNEMFARLAMDVAHTAAFISEVSQSQPGFTQLSIEELSEAPLIPHPHTSSTHPQPGTTVATAIRDTIVKVGENISLRRARALVEDAPVSPSSSTALRLGSYMHGSRHSLQAGPLGALALFRLRSPQLSTLLRQESFRTDLATLERALAQQIVGMNTLSILPRPDLESPEDALYNQQFFTLPTIQGMTVQEALKSWSVQKGLIQEGESEGGIEVVDFLKWGVDQPQA